MRNVYFRMLITAALCIFVMSVIFWLGLLTSNIKSNLFYNDIRSYRTLEPIVSNGPINDTLVNLHGFEYVMNNASICMASMNATQGNELAIAIIIHSARHHFDRRYAIRNTWGSVKMFKGWHLHLTFLLGIDPDSDPEIESQLWDESRLHGDMIMGNFVDTYRNLTYKHLMGYKWVTTFCPSATFILKTDDDIYANVFQIVEVLLIELAGSKKTYICLNMGGNNPIRETSKCKVSKDEYSEDKYPDYCSGSSYLMTADGAAKIYNVGNKTKFLWIDDVFVTGVLREKCNMLVGDNSSSSLEIYSLYDQHHLGNKAEIIAWCEKESVTGQLSHTFILLEEEDNKFVRQMFCIWNKVRLARFAMSNGIT